MWMNSVRMSTTVARWTIHIRISIECNCENYIQGESQTLKASHLSHNWSKIVIDGLNMNKKKIVSTAASRAMMIWCVLIEGHHHRPRTSSLWTYRRTRHICNCVKGNKRRHSRTLLHRNQHRQSEKFICALCVSGNENKNFFCIGSI